MATAPVSELRLKNDDFKKLEFPKDRPTSYKKIIKVAKFIFGGILLGTATYRAIHPWTTKLPGSGDDLLRQQGILSGPILWQDTLDTDYIFQHTLAKTCPEPKAVFQDQLSKSRFDGLTFEQMEQLFGQGRVLDDEEGRNFYNLVAKSMAVYGKQALNTLNHLHPLDEVAKAAVETRHDLRLYVRSVTPKSSEEDAQYLDFLRGQGSCFNRTQIFERYGYNPEVIVAKAGSPNEGVNFWLKFLPSDLTWRRRFIWLGFKLGLV